MSEKEILDKIEKSAAQEKIPESIEPEQIKRKLKENQKNKVKRRSGITYYGAVAAAALVLVIGAAGGIHAVTGGGTGLMTAPVGIEKAASGQKSDEGSEGSSELKDGATAGVEKNAQKKDAGSLYTVAKNYGEVYDAICSGSGQEKEADGIAIIGATGTRYDHAFTNIFVLDESLEAGIRCAIYDKNNKIYLADKSFEIRKDKQFGDYLSFAPMTPEAGLSLSGVKYPLDRYTLRQGESICQSNEITEMIAKVEIFTGKLVVFETRD